MIAFLRSVRNSKTAAQILDDINGMFAYQAKITKGVEHADTLMLPHSVYIDISTRQIPNTGYTVLRFLKENAPYLKDIASAPELESDAEDTNPYNKGVMLILTYSGIPQYLYMELVVCSGSLPFLNTKHLE